MTEDEAKTKWCPFARDMQGAGGNRMAYGGHPPDDQYGVEMALLYPCIGSACMAWRVSRIETPSDHGGLRSTYVRDVGHCGLAGVPR